MSTHVYKKVELTGSSTKSVEDAVQAAVKRASQTLRNMRWFEVKEIRGNIDEDQIQHWQVVIKVGFSME